MLARTKTHTAYISRRKPFEFSGSRIESDMEEHSKIICYEDVTFARPISSHSTITSEKLSEFRSYIDTHAKIISKNIDPVFHGEICDNVSIECPGYPDFKPGIKIGHNVKVNGKVISSVGCSPKARFVGVQGDLVVGKGGFGSFDFTVSSTTDITHLLKGNASHDEKKISLPVQNNSNDYSKDTKKFIFKYENKPKNSDVLKEMELKPHEQSQFLSEWRDAVTKEIPNIPVLLHGKNYDLQTVLSFPNENGIRFNTDTFRGFTLADIQPNTEIADKIQLTIETIHVKRLAANVNKNIESDKEPESRGCNLM